jgi:transposase
MCWTTLVIEAGKRITCLTNNFAFEPERIADLYRQRWKVELFFKWIQQHLRIKAFLGTSENAVKTQIWIAVCTYVLIAIAKKRLHPEHHSLYKILPILSLSMFEQTPINQIRRDSPLSGNGIKCQDWFLEVNLKPLKGEVP